MMFLFRLKYKINQRANLRLFQYISILIISIGLLSCSKQSSSEDSTFRDKLKLVSLKGEPIDVSRFENKVVILNLWATWCGPCINEMLDLEKMRKELPNDIVLVLASNEELDVINRFLESNSFDLEFLKLNGSLESLGVYSLPTTFVISQGGDLIETLVGARRWDTPDQIQTFKNYLK